jgi:Ca2+-binding EF-hand superfamily protein
MEVSELKQMFDAVDSNNDGTITAEEFYSVMSVKIPD